MYRLLATDHLFKKAEAAGSQPSIKPRLRFALRKVNNQKILPTIFLHRGEWGPGKYHILSPRNLEPPFRFCCS
jgi:hypothetical protein